MIELLFRRQPFSGLAPDLPRTYCEELKFGDGFVTKNGRFRYFGTVGDATMPSVSEINSAPWAGLFGIPQAGFFIFAEDYFGNLFLLDKNEKVFCFVVETGEVLDIGAVSHLVEKVIADDLQACPEEYRAIASVFDIGPGFNHHLSCKLPRCFGGTIERDNFDIETRELHLGVVSQAIRFVS